MNNNSYPGSDKIDVKATITDAPIQFSPMELSVDSFLPSRSKGHRSPKHLFYCFESAQLEENCNAALTTIAINNTARLVTTANQIGEAIPEAEQAVRAIANSYAFSAAKRIINF